MSEFEESSNSGEPKDSRDKNFLDIDLIDEKDPNNLLSDISRNIDMSANIFFSVRSSEGFSENPERQKQLAKYIINKFNLSNKGPLLDVGFGSNIHISDTFKEEGIEAYAIDQQAGDTNENRSMWGSPKLERKNDLGVEILSGDIAEINGNDSYLKDKSFGLVLFNGSWSSGGHNWVVAGAVLEGKYYDRKEVVGTLNQFLDNERDNILKSCKDRLNPNGLIGIISSRYAFHGAGYGFTSLPDEKVEFLDVINRFIKLKAKKIHIIGISQSGFDQVLSKSISELPEKYSEYKTSNEGIESVRKQLKTITDLPENSIYLESSYVISLKEGMSKIEELQKIARIDAIFAEF